MKKPGYRLFRLFSSQLGTRFWLYRGSNRPEYFTADSLEKPVFLTQSTKWWWRTFCHTRGKIALIAELLQADALIPIPVADREIPV